VIIKRRAKHWRRDFESTLGEIRIAGKCCVVLFQIGQVLEQPEMHDVPLRRAQTVGITIKLRVQLVLYLTLHP